MKMKIDETQGAAERVSLPRRSPGLYDWVPSEGGPLAMPSVGNFRALSPTAADDLRFAIEIGRSGQNQRPRIDLRPRGGADVEAS